MDPPSLGDPVFLIPSVFHWIFRAIGAIFGSAAEKMGVLQKGLPSELCQVLDQATPASVVQFLFSWRAFSEKY